MSNASDIRELLADSFSLFFFSRVFIPFTLSTRVLLESCMQYAVALSSKIVEVLS